METILKQSGDDFITRCSRCGRIYLYGTLDLYMKDDEPFSKCPECGTENGHVDRIGDKKE